MNMPITIRVIHRMPLICAIQMYQSLDFLSGKSISYTPGLEKTRNFVLNLQDNNSFNNYFGSYPAPPEYRRVSFERSW
jgi:phospholipase C